VRDIITTQVHLAYLFYESAQYGLANEALRQAESRLVSTQGSMEDVAADVWIVLAQLQADTGHLAEAQQSAEKTLSTRRRILPPNHRDIYEAIIVLSYVHWLKGDYDRAATLIKDGRQGYLNVLRKDHPDLAWVFSLQAYISHALGHVPSALKDYKESLRIREKELGLDHPLTAISLHDLGIVYLETADTEALPILQRALSIRLNAFGEDNLYPAATNQALGRLYFESGENAEALSRAQKALAVRLHHLEPDHQDVAETYNLLGSIYLDLGQLEDARRHIDKGLQLRRRRLGPNHLLTAESIEMVALIHLDSGNLSQAEETLRSATRIREQNAPSDHPDLGYSYNNLGYVLYLQKHYDEAESYLRKAVGIRESKSPAHMNLAQSYNNLGNLLSKTSRYKGAVEAHEKALSIVRARVGDRHLATATTMANLAIPYLGLGDADMAAQWARKAVDLMREQRTQSVDLANALDLLALCYSEMGLERAPTTPSSRDLLEEARSIRVALFGADHPEVARNVASLIYISEREGRVDDAKVYRGELQRMRDPWFHILGQDFASVRILFGTDRAPYEETGRSGFGPDMARKLSLGSALLTVPLSNRSLGEAPRPLRVTGVGLRFYWETESPKLHATLSELAPLSVGSFAVRTRESVANARRFPRQALLFVHGFANTLVTSLYSAAAMARDLQFDGQVFAFSWPSHGALSEWAYRDDEKRSAQAVPFLRAFIELLANDPEIAKLHIVAHSMGNAPTSEVLQQLILSRAETIVPKLGEIIFAAPDLDRNLFENRVRDFGSKLGPRLTLYASSSDLALYTAPKVSAGSNRAGFIVDGTPLLIPGVDVIDVTAAGSIFSLNHDLHMTSATLIQDIGRLFKTGTRPPNIRTPAFAPVATPKGTFYRLTLQR
jgi:esterase/lipase superfamily enzyme/Tfp pilus assembly protein PilF